MSDASPVLLTPDVVGGLAGKRVLVVGDIMLDAYLIGDADRISPEAPVPVVRIEKERYLLGGAGNVARNIVALGGVATLAGGMGAAFDGLSLYHGGGGLQVLHSLCTDFTFHLHKV